MDTRYRGLTVAAVFAVIIAQVAILTEGCGSSSDGESPNAFASDDASASDADGGGNPRDAAGAEDVDATPGRDGASSRIELPGVCMQDRPLAAATRPG